MKWRNEWRSKTGSLARPHQHLSPEALCVDDPGGCGWRVKGRVSGRCSSSLSARRGYASVARDQWRKPTPVTSTWRRDLENDGESFSGIVLHFVPHDVAVGSNGKTDKIHQVFFVNSTIIRYLLILAARHKTLVFAILQRAFVLYHYLFYL